MQTSNWWRAPQLGLAAALGLIVLALTAFAAAAEVEVEKDVRVKVIECEGDECTEMIENLTEGKFAHVIVGDGEHKKIVIRKVDCDGEDCEEQDLHNMVFVGGDGNVEVLAGDKGHAWRSHHGEMLGGGYLGVGLTELTPELREHFGVPEGAGVMVSKVMDESPAFKAGLEVGDIIASADGDPIASGSALAATIRGQTAGDEVVLGVWRDGVERSITAAVEERSAGIHLGGLKHMSPGKHMRKIIVRCDSDDEDCDPNVDIAGLGDFDCGGSGECEVKVKCKDGGCTCTINGEDTDCAGIPGVPGVVGAGE